MIRNQIFSGKTNFDYCEATRGKYSRAERAGFAVNLNWNNLTSDDLYDAITKMIEDNDVQDSLTKAHELFVDEKESPLERLNVKNSICKIIRLSRGVWYVEYLKRHGHTQFLKPYSANMSWIQYHLLDVIAVFISVITIFIFIIISFCRCLCSRCCSKKVKTD